jgi:rhodanese-related sulfurtransferase
MYTFLNNHFSGSIVSFIWDNVFLICVVAYCILSLLWPRIRRGSRITHSTATALINSKNASIIDIRSKKEYKAGHLLNAIHVPYESLEDDLHRIENLKSQNVIVICDDGKLSRTASSFLRSSGFTKVFSLDGGISGWKANGLPVSL